MPISWVELLWFFVGPLPNGSLKLLQVFEFCTISRTTAIKSNNATKCLSFISFECRIRKCGFRKKNSHINYMVRKKNFFWSHEKLTYVRMCGIWCIWILCLHFALFLIKSNVAVNGLMRNSDLLDGFEYEIRLRK